MERGQQEKTNDRNDRAIRVASQWYSEHLNRKVLIVLLTNDVANRETARNEGIVSYSG